MRRHSPVQLGWLLLCLSVGPLQTLRAQPSEIRVVADNNYPPYLFVGNDGKREGYEVDKWHLFEAHTGIKVKLDPMSWAEAQKAILAGHADVIDMIYRTPARAQLYDFSRPYGTNLIAIYVDQRIHGVHDATALRGLPVGVERGDACADRLRAEGVEDLRFFKDYRDIIQAATGGALHIFCMDENPASYYLHRYAHSHHFYKAFVLYTGKVHWAVRKGNRALLATVAQGMAKITPAERETLRKRWLDRPVALWPYVRMAKIAGAILVVIALIVGLWLALLHRVVAKRTRALAESESTLRIAAAAFETQEALMVTDANHVIQRVNQAFTELTGYAPADVIGQHPSILRSRYHDDTFYSERRQQIEATGYWKGEQWIRDRHGELKVVGMIVSSVADRQGTNQHYVASMVDLTREREAHARLDHMTFFDPLTDLPNRPYLQGQLADALGSGDSAAGALLLIDLDHFKRVNDLRGHAVGDQLLRRVAQRLRERLDERCLLCRFSGGTFALLESCHDELCGAGPDQAGRCASQIRAALDAPFPTEGSPPVTITASIGWTTLVPGTTAETVLKEAELAMYSAKAAGRNQVHQYDPAMHAALARRESLLHELREAITTTGLTLHLQPQTDRTGRMTGAEALLRWTRACGERVPPAAFIPLAEESDLILAVGHWVLKRACEHLARWADDPQLEGLSLSVNVSSRQFSHPDFIADVQALVTATGANPRRLKLEITESMVIDNLAEAADKLQALQHTGIQTSLDDFGTGYSSLTYLATLGLDQLKIDQTFVARIPDSRRDAIVARAIVTMGRGLGMEVIAEGVETQAQRTFLLNEGCDAFQGYLIARPMPVEAFEALFTCETSHVPS